MGLWAIVIPEATTNLLTNPSAENATTGWAFDSGIIGTRDTTCAFRGIASVKIVKSSGTYVEGGSGIAYVSGTSYTFSIHVRRNDGAPVTIADVTGMTIFGISATPTFENCGRGWYRVKGTVTPNSTSTGSARANFANGTYYIDAAQLEALGYATTYVDGDEDGCVWNGTNHGSTSSRPVTTRLGGRVYDFDTWSVDVVAHSGIGMPPLTQITQDRALLPGAAYLGSKVSPRVIALSLLLRGSDLSNLHLLRKQLIDLVKPDLTPTQQPFIVRYTGSGIPVEIPVVYDSGLDHPSKEGYTENFSIRLVAYDQPFWSELGRRASSISVSSTFTLNYIAGRSNGIWSNLGNGISGGEAYCFAIGKDKCLYVGGIFTSAGGSSANYIAKWDGTAWSTVGTGMNGAVYSLAVAADGTIYASGAFTTAGGVSATRIAKWNGSAWSALGSGLGAAANSMVFSTDGSLYCGGAFTTAGGSSANYIAKWDGSSWSTLGTGMNSTIYSLVFDAAGNLFAGGAFTTAGGTTVNYIAKWNGSAWSAIGSGAGANVRSVAIAPNGMLYATGSFTSIGGVSANYIARWNGSSWAALGTGLNDVGYCVAASPSGVIFASGIFTQVSGIAVDGIAAWNGTAWTPIELDFSGTTFGRLIFPSGNDLYVAYTESGTATVAASGSITLSQNNPSTVTTYPVVKIKRSGGTSVVVRQLSNATTGKNIYLNYTMSDGETLTIDLRPGRKTFISDQFGNVLRYVLPNSNVVDFGLAPGSNTLTFYSTTAGSPTVTVSLTWQVLHWSADGGAS